MRESKYAVLYVCVCVCACVRACVCSNSQLYCYRLDGMKSEQAKLQSQLKEFEKKQADYEEVRLDHHSSVSHDLLVMVQELKKTKQELNKLNKT